MIRLACLFALIALAALVLMTLRLDGGTATIFSFVGCPSLAIALGLYALGRRHRAQTARVH